MNNIEEARKDGFCVCCGYNTLLEGEMGSYYICPVCGWEDDPVDYSNPERVSSSNRISLKQAMENFQKFNASKKEHVESTRAPKNLENQHADWPWSFE